MTRALTMLMAGIIAIYCVIMTVCIILEMRTEKKVYVEIVFDGDDTTVQKYHKSGWKKGR